MPIAGITAAWRGLIDVLLPAHCVGCGGDGTYLCAACLDAARRLPPLIMEPGAFAFDTATAPFAYEGVPRTAVHRLKFTGLRAIAPAMAVPMAEALALRRSAPGRQAVVVPVPLHPRRLRERGHNQAGLLARKVAALLGLRLDERLLTRRTYEQPQVSAGGVEARMANVEGAFGVTSVAGVRRLNVVLVDDVMTTGSTLDSAARALKDAGVRRVHALTFAREP